MINNWMEFSDIYPSLAGQLAGDFHDSETVDDGFNARNTRLDLPHKHRIELLSHLLVDARKLMLNIEAEWQIMAEMANRRIYNVAEARAWLTLIIDGWQEELDRLQGEGPKRR